MQDFTNTAKLNVFMELTNLTSGLKPCVHCESSRQCHCKDARGPSFTPPHAKLLNLPTVCGSLAHILVVVVAH